MRSRARCHAARGALAPGAERGAPAPMRQEMCGRAPAGWYGMIAGVLVEDRELADGAMIQAALMLKYNQRKVG